MPHCVGHVGTSSGDPATHQIATALDSDKPLRVEVTEGTDAALAGISGSVCGLSHDLDNYLHVACVFSQLLLKDEKLSNDPSARIWLEFVQTAVLGAHEIIQGELRYAGMLSAKPEPFQSVELNECVRNARRILEPKFRKTAAELDSMDLPCVWGEANQITRMLINLMDNSLKYRRTNGSPHITIAASSTGSDDVTITITDNGIGFNPKDRYTIFEKGKRLQDNDAEGSGLGLAIVRDIVKRLGGAVEANSPGPGKGATMLITLPGVKSAPMNGFVPPKPPAA